VDIAAFHPAELLKSLVERGDPGLCFQVIVGIAHQHADTPYAFTLLRARREGPRRRRAADERDELAALQRRDHSITSSAQARNIDRTLQHNLQKPAFVVSIE
jgi:hypothetical protein